MKISCVDYLLTMLNVARTIFYRMVMMVSSCNLRSLVTDMFLNDIITDDIIMLIFTSLSFFLF